MARKKGQINPELTERLSCLLRFSGLTHKEFAAILGKTDRTLSFWLANQTPIPVKLILDSFEKLKEFRVFCTEKWFLHGEGPGPRWSDKTSDKNIFAHFNLDYTFSTLTGFFKESYPNSIHSLIFDDNYAPRITPYTLLIAVPLDQSKFKHNWRYGYLYPKSDLKILPVDIEKIEDKLIATPFQIDGFDSKSFEIKKDDYIFPIINIRPLY